MKKPTRKEECINEALGHLHSLVGCTDFCGDVSKAIEGRCGVSMALLKTGGTTQSEIVCDDIVSRYNTTPNFSMGKFGKSVKNPLKRKMYQQRYFGYIKAAVKTYGDVAGIPPKVLYKAFNLFVEP